MSILSLFTMGLFMVSLVVSVASIKPEKKRTVENVLAICEPRQALEFATCVDCQDKNCNVCAEDSQKCDECDEGFVISKTNGCAKCKDNCVQCEDFTEKCLECELGYVLSQNNECVKCDDKPYIECEVCIGLDY